MSKVVLLVGTRKGCFVLESDGDRRDWQVRGPFCEGWPIYHAVHDPVSGTIYAALYELQDDELLAKLVGLGKRLQIVTVPGGHLVYWDAHDAMAEAVDRFLGQESD